MRYTLYVIRHFKSKANKSKVKSEFVQRGWPLQVICISTWDTFSFLVCSTLTREEILYTGCRITLSIQAILQNMHHIANQSQDMSRNKSKDKIQYLHDTTKC